MVGHNKHQNALIRKKCRKGDVYRCCKPLKGGNKNKYSRGYCCTFPQLYKRRDIAVQNERVCFFTDDDIIIEYK